MVSYIHTDNRCFMQAHFIQCYIVYTCYSGSPLPVSSPLRLNPTHLILLFWCHRAQNSIIMMTASSRITAPATTATSMSVLEPKALPTWPDVGVAVETMLPVHIESCRLEMLTGQDESKVTLATPEVTPGWPLTHVLTRETIAADVSVSVLTT